MGFDKSTFRQNLNSRVEDLFGGDNKKFAEACKIVDENAAPSDVSIGRYREKGTLPRLDSLAIMAMVLGVSLDELAGIEKPTADLNQQRAVREDAARFFASGDNDQRPPLQTTEFMGGVFEIAGNEITVDLVIRGPMERALLGRYRGPE